MKMILSLSLFLFSATLGYSHSTEFSAKITADPFVGTFVMSVNGQTAGNVIISHSGGNQYKIDTGNGYDVAIKNGNVLEGTSQGVPFRILASGDNLTMELLGSNISLTRISVPAVTPTAASPEDQGSKSFVGTYNVSLNGQTGGTLVITQLGGNTYKVDSGDGADNATQYGNSLEGTSGGVPFKITISGNNLVMEVMGTRIDLIRANSGTTTSPGAGTGNMDPRLLGTWSKTTAYNSGNAGTSSGTVITFLANGTFQLQTTFSAGGDGWSTGSNSDPVQTGTYTVTNVNQKGGTLIIQGKQEGYMIYTYDGNTRLALDSEKLPFTKIR